MLIAGFNAQSGERAQVQATAPAFADHCTFRQMAVASEKTVADVLGFARAQFGRLAIVFNNAGVGGAIGPLTETTEAD